MFSSSLVPFYIVPNLSSTISKELNFKTCSAITLHKRNETTDIISRIRDLLKPIEYAGSKQPTNIVFKPPTLERPIGKSGKKRLKRKKKRQLKKEL
jgi:hypothetical protein